MNYTYDLNKGGKQTKQQIMASKVAKTPEGKGYLEVNGKPFLMGHVQNCGAQQLKGNSAQEPYPVPLPVSWLENCFEKTAALGYRTISIVTKWNEIEPKYQGEFDWTLIDLYVNWADKYDLYLDIAWFGSNACGGTRLPGYGRGWACWVPEYVQDHDRYFGNGVNRYEANSEVNCPWLPDGGPRHQDAENLFTGERNAVRELFNHLAVKDKNGRTILFQVFNELNCHTEWFSKKHIWLDLINQMGKAVKEADYVVATRVNMATGVIDSDVSALQYIDFVGCDPYIASVAGIRESLYSGKSAIPYVAENYGQLSNTSTLALVALMHGGYYHPWQLNDHWEDIGMYEKTAETYTGWKLGIMPPMRESARDMANFNTAMNKIGSLIATSPISRMMGFNIETDHPVQEYRKIKQLEDDIELGFQCEDGSVGLAVQENGCLYLLSDTSGLVTYYVNKKPISVSRGILDANSNWVRLDDVIPNDNEDDSCSIGYKSQDCIRVEF